MEGISENLPWERQFWHFLAKSKVLFPFSFCFFLLVIVSPNLYFNNRSKLAMSNTTPHSLSYSWHLCTPSMSFRGLDGVPWSIRQGVHKKTSDSDLLNSCRGPDHLSRKIYQSHRNDNQMFICFIRFEEISFTHFTIL